MSPWSMQVPKTPLRCERYRLFKINGLSYHLFARRYTRNLWTSWYNSNWLLGNIGLINCCRRCSQLFAAMGTNDLHWRRSFVMSSAPLNVSRSLVMSSWFYIVSIQRSLGLALLLVSSNLTCGAYTMCGIPFLHRRDISNRTSVAIYVRRWRSWN